MQRVANGGVDLPGAYPAQILDVSTFRDSAPEFKSREVSRLMRRLDDGQRTHLVEARRGVATLKRAMQGLPKEMRDALLSELLASLL